MKVIFSSILLLLVPFALASSNLPPADEKRALRGESSSPFTSSSSVGERNLKLCAPISNLYINQADREQTKEKTGLTPDTETYSAPFYINSSNKPAGTWYDSNTGVGSSCIGTSRLVFNGNTAITLSYDCTGSTDVITGGSGKYPCARGQAVFSATNTTFNLDFTTLACGC